MAAIEREKITEWLTSILLRAGRFAAGHVVIVCAFVLLARTSLVYI